MNQKPTENDVRQTFQRKSVQPSEEWIDVTRTKLQKLAIADDSFDWKFNDVRRYLMQFFIPNNSFQMKKAFAVLSVVVLFGGFFLLNQPATIIAREKLDDARQILAQLKSFNQTGEFAKVEEPSLFPTTYADSTEEDEVAEAVEELEETLDEAIEEAEEIDDPAQTAEILEEIDEVQDEAIEILAETIENVEDEKVIETIAEVIEDTAEENEAVEEAQEAAEEAVENEEETVVVDIETEDEDKKGKTEKYDFRLETATTLYEKVKAEIETSGIEVDKKLQKKIDRVEKDIEKCTENSKAKNCKAGRIKGLSRAIQSKIKNNVRKLEKEQKKNKKKNNDDLTSGSGSVVDIDEEDVDKITKKGKGHSAESGRERAMGQDKKAKKKERKGKMNAEDREDESPSDERMSPGGKKALKQSKKVEKKERKETRKAEKNKNDDSDITENIDEEEEHNTEDIPEKKHVESKGGSKNKGNSNKNESTDKTDEESDTTEEEENNTEDISEKKHIESKGKSENKGNSNKNKSTDKTDDESDTTENIDEEEEHNTEDTGSRPSKGNQGGKGKKK